MSTWTAIGAAYLVGGLPFSYWIVRWRRGLDLRQEGSQNPGATNALRVGGVGTGLTTLLLDLLKGCVVIVLARRLGVVETHLGAVALAAVVGHCFPVWLSLRGGKGVAAAAGAYLLLAPGALAISAVVFVAVVALSRVVALGSIAAAITVPVAQLALDWTAGAAAFDPVIPWSLAIAVLVVARHHSNLRRLWARRPTAAKREDS